MKEYMDLQHAEVVPVNDLEKPQHMVFYLPMHAVYKQSSSTTKECYSISDCIVLLSLQMLIKFIEQLNRLMMTRIYIILYGFHLRNWNSSELAVLKKIDPGDRDSYEVLTISGSKEYAKTLGFEWNTTFDYFRLPVNNLSTPETIT